MSFLADLEGISPIEAIERIHGSHRLPDTPPPADFLDHLRRLLSDPDPIDPRDEGNPFEPYPDWVKPLWPFVDTSQPEAYLVRRGFSWDLMEEYGILWDPRRRRVVIPVEQDGVLVGAKGRAIDDGAHPKYLNYAPEYRISRTLFNKDRARNGSGPLIIVEGELDALALDATGHTAIALGGSHMSNDQEEMIARLNPVGTIVVLWFDNDDAGRSGLFEAAHRLRSWFQVAHLVTDDDPAGIMEKYGEDAISELLSKVKVVL